MLNPRLRLLRWVLTVALAWSSWGVMGQTAASDPATLHLTREDFLQLVLERNESVQVRVLELEITRKKHQGEWGVFEPELVGGADHVYNKRENTSEQRRSLGVAIFEEENNIYTGGLEALVPSGARVRLGYSLRDLNNNLQEPPLGTIVTNFADGEYQTFLGISLTQPLLRNAWFPATLANVRLAALASELAFQDYRRQMMLIISTAEAIYWNLYLAQEQVAFFKESVALAETILRDNRERLRAGRGSELEVQEAEAALALRRTKQSEALEKLYEAVNRVRTLYSETAVSTNRLVLAVDEPEAVHVPLSYYDSWQLAFELNPDYQSQRRKVLQEQVRLAYAKNQRWPQLDLKASYGLNGLGDSPGTSWRDVESQEFPSWSVGVELRVPIFGGIRSRNELDAAKLRKKQALVNMKEVETQLANGLDTAIHKIQNARDTVASYREVVNYNQNLLQTMLTRLEVGRVESRKVLEVEADLLETRNALAEATVQYERSLLELELIEGSTLRRRNLELTQRELERKTAELLRKGDFKHADYVRFVHQVQTDYQRKHPGPTVRPVAQPAPALPAVSVPAPAPAPAPPPPLIPAPAPAVLPAGMSDETYEKALQLLRETPTAPGPAPAVK